MPFVFRRHPTAEYIRQMVLLTRPGVGPQLLFLDQGSEFFRLSGFGVCFRLGRVLPKGLSGLCAI